MKKTLLRIVVVSIIVISCSILLLSCSNNEKSNPELLYAEWMSYIKDDVKFQDVIIPETHNTIAINCDKMPGLSLLVDLSFLNCQQDGVYKQLQYGVRNLDIRIGAQNGDYFGAHGLGISDVKLSTALEDVVRFVDEHPSEFIMITLYPYVSKNVSKPQEVVSLVSKIVDFDKYVIPYVPEAQRGNAEFAGIESIDLSKATMGDLRKTGKNIIFSTGNYVPTPYVNASRNVSGTWSQEFSVGVVANDGGLYEHLKELLMNENSQKYSIGLNRASGSGSDLDEILDTITGRKEKPLDFMLSDRPLFLELVSWLEENPEYLANLSGVCFDFGTYDHVQPGHAIRLNAAKGLVKKELLFRFTVDVNAMIEKQNINP
ncbi:MAG: hypothetical protein LBU04_03005 [Christensenellaceae bacterium]|nr:hypothetical protein [Christensenellaceae bacterium]